MQIDINTIQADVSACRNRIRTLQSETIHTITIKPSGKVEVVDKTQLESLNGEIDSLNEMASHNVAVLGRLEAVLQKAEFASIAGLDHAKNKTADRIESHKMRINRVIATWLKVDANYDLESIRKHPRVAPEIATYEPLIPQEEAKLAKLSAMLKEANAIIAEYKPSGVEAPKASLRSSLVKFDLRAAQSKGLV
jgi:hypothetical protein